MVLPEYRGNKLAKRVAASLILAVLQQGKIPHWDAANKVSANLAQSLGYRFSATYEAFRVFKK